MSTTNSHKNISTATTTATMVTVMTSCPTGHTVTRIITCRRGMRTPMRRQSMMRIGIESADQLLIDH
jgi:hypothetical protein